MVGKVCFIKHNKMIRCVLMDGWNSRFSPFNDFMDGRIAGEVLQQIKDTYNHLQKLTVSDKDKNDYYLYLAAWFKVLTGAEGDPDAKIVLV